MLAGPMALKRQFKTVAHFPNVCALFSIFFEGRPKTRRRQANPNQTIAMPLAEAHLPDFTGMLFYSTSTMRILGKALDLGSERGAGLRSFF